MIFSRIGAISSSGNRSGGSGPPPGPVPILWHETNWPLTSAIANDNNSWEDTYTLLINEYSGNGNTELITYIDSAGVEISPGDTLEITIEFDDLTSNAPGAELEIGFFDVNGNKIPEYVYPSSPDTVYTITVPGSSFSNNLRGISFFNSFGIGSAVRVTNLDVAPPS